MNWCPALGTVLANDEAKDGISVRGGHPVEKIMQQRSLRISAYAERLLQGLEKVEWPITDQRNAAQLDSNRGCRSGFRGKNSRGPTRKTADSTTRPDTIFGVSFMVLAGQRAIRALKLTTPAQRAAGRSI